MPKGIPGLAKTSLDTQKSQSKELESDLKIRTSFSKMPYLPLAPMNLKKVVYNLELNLRIH